MKTILKLVIAMAAVAAAAGLDIPAARAFGDAPWCAVISLGDGDLHWDCEYRTVEDCVPNVLAGNRGFCDLNPYGPGPSASVKRAHARHRDRRVEQH